MASAAILALAAAFRRFAFGHALTGVDPHTMDSPLRLFGHCGGSGAGKREHEGGRRKGARGANVCFHHSLRIESR